MFADAEPDEEMLQLIMSNHEQFNFEELFEKYSRSNGDSKCAAASCILFHICFVCVFSGRKRV
jgi:hypothetical protein